MTLRMIYIKLTEEEKSELNNLYKSSLNVVVRRRSLSLLLSHDKHFDGLGIKNHTRQ